MISSKTKPWKTSVLGLFVVFNFAFGRHVERTLFATFGGDFHVGMVDPIFTKFSNNSVANPIASAIV